MSSKCKHVSLFVNVEMWEELMTCCDPCGLSCNPPQPKNIENECAHLSVGVQIQGYEIKIYDNRYF